MQIVLNIAEDSNVELVKGDYELIQGECCVTELKFNFPETIRGVAVGNYTKRIEFGECKDLGECVKFIDDIEGDIYELGERCTAFKKIMLQVVLTYGKITWKTLPVALEFHESVNAEGNTVIQAQILSLSKIEREWENYIKANTFRVVYNVANVPTADASSLGETIFYLGANTDSVPYLVYGHYYRCNLVNGVYEWTDLTQDPNLAGVADGIREINKNQTLQFWKGTTEELENEVPQENVGYIADDKDAYEIISAILSKAPLYRHDAIISIKVQGTRMESTMSRTFKAIYSVPVQYYDYSNEPLADGQNFLLNGGKFDGNINITPEEITTLTYATGKTTTVKGGSSSVAETIKRTGAESFIIEGENTPALYNGLSVAIRKDESDCFSVVDTIIRIR